MFRAAMDVIMQMDDIVNKLIEVDPEANVTVTDWPNPSLWDPADGSAQGMMNVQPPLLTPMDLTRIGTALYRGVAYNGRSAWQSWLADGLMVNSVTVRRWLMANTISRRSMPVPIARLLLAAEGVAEHLALWDQPRGTVIVDRMADVSRTGTSKRPTNDWRA